MLDLRCKHLLKYLVKECNIGSYRILDIDDMLQAIPKKFKPDKEIILQILQYLENGGYINVKYSDDEQFCLCPMPFGRQFIENDEIQNKNQKLFEKLSVKNNIITFILAFLGAFLAIIISKLF